MPKIFIRVLPKERVELVSYPVRVTQGMVEALGVDYTLHLLTDFGGPVKVRLKIRFFLLSVSHERKS
jgi:hypothetical protein